MPKPVTPSNNNPAAGIFCYDDVVVCINQCGRNTVNGVPPLRTSLDPKQCPIGGPVLRRKILTARHPNWAIRAIPNGDPRYHDITAGIHRYCPSVTMCFRQALVLQIPQQGPVCRRVFDGTPSPRDKRIPAVINGQVVGDFIPIRCVGMFPDQCSIYGSVLGRLITHADLRIITNHDHVPACVHGHG
jgi:hypothetical protein